jgi:gluconate 5-dehydrogenase
VLVARTQVDLERAAGEIGERATWVAADVADEAEIDRGWGRIVHLGSQQSWRAFGNSGGYGAAKAGLLGLTRSQAEAWSGRGVTVNCVIPGFVRTAMTERIFVEEPERAAALAERTMIGRNGVPGDFAGIAVFLCSDAAAFVTGQAIAVDGGFSAT